MFRLSDVVVDWIAAHHVEAVAEPAQEKKEDDSRTTAKAYEKSNDALLYDVGKSFSWKKEEKQDEKKELRERRAREAGDAENENA